MLGNLPLEAGERGQHRGQRQDDCIRGEEDSASQSKGGKENLMDLTNGLGPAVQSISDKIPAVIQALTDAGKADEAALLQGVQADLAQLGTMEPQIVQQFLAGISADLQPFAAAITRVADFLDRISPPPVKS